MKIFLPTPCIRDIFTQIRKFIVTSTIGDHVNDIKIACYLRLKKVLYLCAPYFGLKLSLKLSSNFGPNQAQLTTLVYVAKILVTLFNDTST